MTFYFIIIIVLVHQVILNENEKCFTVKLLKKNVYLTLVNDYR